MSLMNCDYGVYSLYVVGAKRTFLKVYYLKVVVIESCVSIRISVDEDGLGIQVFKYSANLNFQN